MRYLFFSDIHSNLEAFETFLKIINKEKFDQLIFLGDAIGYYTKPKETLGLLKNLNSINLAGNHDWALLDKFSLAYFNEEAYEVLIWTKDRLRQEDFNFLESFVLVYEKKDFVCVHASLYEPEAFNYVFDETSANRVFSLLNKKICFLGHTHIAGTYFKKAKQIFYTSKEKIDLEDDVQYIVNVGSIGQPRDNDIRGSFCIYDEKEKKIEIKRFSYDLEKTAHEIFINNLPNFLAYRLYLGK